MEDYEVSYYTIYWWYSPPNQCELKHKNFENEAEALQFYKKLLNTHNVYGIKFHKVLKRIAFPWDVD